MAITQISKIQIRSGNLADLPQLAVGELGFATDENQLFIGNDSSTTFGVLPNNIEILTVLSDIPAPGITGDVLFNNGGIMSVASNLNPNATFTYNALGGTSGNGLLTVEEMSVLGTSNLGVVSDVIILGGTSGQVLSTDGSGSLSWITVAGGSTTSITNGTSNVSMPAADGNVNTSVGGVANVFVVTSTGANVTGTLDVTGNITGSNLTLTGNLSLPVGSTFAAAAISATGNIVAVGNVSGGNLATTGDLTVTGNGAITGNVSVGNITTTGNIDGGNLTITGKSTLGAVGNITITGGTSGQVLTTNGSGLLSWSTVGSGSLSNGTSGVSIPVPDGNVNTSVGGVANVFVVTSTGANVTGTLDVTGNANVGNLGTTGILTTGDVTIGGNLTVNGTTTTVNSNVVTINDLALTVANNATTRALADGSGFIVSDSNFASFLYRSGTNAFESSQTIISPGITTTTLTANGAVSLGSVANLSVTGGTSGQFLQTDGSGTLTWATVNSSGLANGTSNISIPTVNGNVNTSVGGTANVLVVTSTGANIAGTMNATGTVTGGNFNTSGAVVASTLTSNVATGTAPFTVTSTTQVANLNAATAGTATTSDTVTTNAQPNITSVGTLTSVAVSGTSNLNAIGNVTITGGSSGQAIVTNGSGVLSFATVGDVTLTGTQTLTNKTLTSPTITSPTLNNGYTEQVFAVTGTTPALAPENGSIQTWTLSASSTPTAGTWASGQSITIMVESGASFTITWTSLPVTWKTDGGTAPTLNASGYTAIALWKVGTTIFGARVGNA